MQKRHAAIAMFFVFTLGMGLAGLPTGYLLNIVRLARNTDGHHSQETRKWHGMTIVQPVRALPPILRETLVS